MPVKPSKLSVQSHSIFNAAKKCCIIRTIPITFPAKKDYYIVGD